MNFKFNMIPTVSLIFLLLYVGISIVNVYFAYKENEKLRKTTKPFCLLALFIAAIFWKQNLLFLYIGIIFDLAGDILLIWKHKLKVFILGSMFFFLGHICYTIQAFILFGDKLSWMFYVVVIFFLLIFNLLGYRFTRKITRNEILAVMSDIYVSILLFTLIIFFAGCVAGYATFMLIAALGMTSFVISDLIIIYTKFIKKFKRQEYYIMSLYLTAQFMVVLGFCMTMCII